MASEMQPTRFREESNQSIAYLQKFILYETRANFYMIGRDKSRTVWRVLKIDRLEPSELNILEDSTRYSEIECCDLLRRINDGNKSTGGLKFVSTCYGIVGFVKFLGPHYMLLITNRRKIGVICGNAVYAITKSKMIPIPNSTVQSNMVYSKNENRFKKLLCTVDLTKDFFFSYSYHVMRSFQKNMDNHEAGQLIYETMFVWNEFMTRGIRYHLKNTLWTVALAYGFFKQVKLSTSGRDFKLTIIARRSRHYAGTRYLKRGVNEKGHVANDVETEQIVFEDVPEGCMTQISSVVQNRGSIPVFWSQETSRLNIKPDIILSKKDQSYEATRLHFKNLVKRYGNPIIILNLIKTCEKRARESILHTEFCNAIDLMNKELSEENRLKFLHWDLNKFSRNKATNVLALLTKMAAYALNLTGFFHCEVRTTKMLNCSYFKNSDGDDCRLQKKDSDDLNKEVCNGMGDASGNPLLEPTFQKGVLQTNCIDGLQKKDSDDLKKEVCNGLGDASGNHLLKPTFQKGVLRTNCIDCLDRTNVAQFAYGLVALGHQLHALGLTNTSNIDLDSPLADELMNTYETMGDTLALQYGGSAAHNKIFSQRRGQWKAATQSQEFLRTLHRYYSNAYMDAEKQEAINMFLGHFQPHQGKPGLWELDSDQHHNVGIRDSNFSDENARSSFKRSLSDGNIICEHYSPIENGNLDKNENFNQTLTDKLQGGNGVLSESTPEILNCDTDASYSRYTHATSIKQFFPDMHPEQCYKSDSLGLSEHWDFFNCSNFLEADWHSSSGNSCEEELYERSSLISNPIASLSSDSVANEQVGTSASESESSMKGSERSVTDLNFDAAQSSDILAEFSDNFVNWVERCCSLDFRH